MSEELQKIAKRAHQILTISKLPMRVSHLVCAVEGTSNEYANMEVFKIQRDKNLDKQGCPTSPADFLKEKYKEYGLCRFELGKNAVYYYNPSVCRVMFDPYNRTFSCKTIPFGD